VITNPVSSPTAVTRQWFLARSDLETLIQALRKSGRRVIGPTVRESAIVYDEIESAAALPVGMRDEQSPGAIG